MSGKDELRRRFAGQSGGEGRAPGRRADYLGTRVGVMLRVSPDVRRKMKLLRALTSANVNELCEGAILAALDERLEAVKGAMKPDEWESVVRAIDGASPRSAD